MIYRICLSDAASGAPFDAVSYPSEADGRRPELFRRSCIPFSAGTTNGKVYTSSKGGFDYIIIRSDRKSFGMKVTSDGTVEARVPLHCTQREATDFVEERADWVLKSLDRLTERRKTKACQEPVPKLTYEEIKALAAQAAKVIPPKAAYYAQLLGVTYRQIAIRNQTSRWGSCSSKGNLNFNCLLMLAPDEVLDSVVVHELCHLKHMNHSKDFYDEVLRVFPDYKRCHQWLKEHGEEIMARNIYERR